MKLHLFLLLTLILGLKAYCQPRAFQGTYGDGGQTNESPYRQLEIHYEKNGSILFYLEAGLGAPNYNSGNLYGRLSVDKKTGHLLYLPVNNENDCTLEFVKSKNHITVRTLKGQCQFGSGVVADGVYKMSSAANPQFFTDATGKKVYFSKTKP